MTWRPLIVLGAGVLGIFCGMLAGFIYTVAVGGIHPGSNREYVVHALVATGMIVGLAVGWWLT